MKAPIYIVAILVSGATGYFSFQNKAAHEKQLADTVELQEGNIRLQGTIDKKVKDTKAMRDDFDKEFKALSRTNADIDSEESTNGDLRRSISKLNGKIRVVEEQLATIDEAVQRIRDLFKGQDITLDEVPAFVARLEKQKRDLTKELEELTNHVEVKQQNVDKNHSSIADVNGRISARSKRLLANSVSSLVTAVNSDWGFVTVKPHKDAAITEDSNLIVVRGSQHVGRLVINAIEPNRIIADIDFDSVAPGLRILPGDHVILAEPNSN